MIHYKNAANKILTEGIYNLLLEDIKKESGKTEISETEIEAALQTNKEFLNEYKRLNRENHVSNIEIGELNIKENETADKKQLKEEINANVKKLKSLEKFETPYGESFQFLWIISIAVGLIFILHNIVSVFTDLYNTFKAGVFSGFGLIIVLAGLYIFQTYRTHKRNHILFRALYVKTKAMINDAVKSGKIRREELFP